MTAQNVSVIKDVNFLICWRACPLWFIFLCPVVLVAFVLFSKLPCQVINDSDLFKIFVLFFIDF